ncbi:MAG: hypothetical protein A3D24_03700 [Candidatus Blackburnbacteria bacterium RIFCSPHIGHO2_02_FULL_39_13]|nr:MAG: hypothetical protein A3D24_03700 [Candidatus Blackburnbacteria bacterium RIFCSPHIGHO2_02_FULL_39_13]
MEKIRTRTAPSPTGFAHVGTAYGALFNYAFAKKNNGKYIIRLEDTDVKRNVEGAEEEILASLSWLGITWDEGPDSGGPHFPYKQSQRLEIYKEKVKELLNKKLAYEDDGAIKLKGSQDDIVWEDLIRGSITFPASEVNDFVIVKSDGYPTYHFAVVIDDHLMEISHVIRGEEHISNTPRQIALYKAFGWELPKFGHFPTLRGADRKKLSKRRDPVNLKIFRQEGYLPEALVNFLCLLGWSHPEGKEIFTIAEFVDNFSLDRVRKAGPVFDTQKLDWINGEYIRKTSDEELVKITLEHITGDVPEDFLLKVIPLIKERMAKLSEAQGLLEFFWQQPAWIKEIFEDPKSLEHLASANIALSGVKVWDLENINKALGEKIVKNEFKTGNFYMTLRLAMAGKRITPPINESMVILGQDQVLHRIHDAESILVSVESPEIQ